MFYTNGTCVINSVHASFFTMATYCTAGHEGSVGDLSCMSIFSACFGLLTSLQLASTTWSGQIWISCWILPHFDVRTISVAWKLKELPNIFWQQIFFLLNPLSNGVAPLCNGKTFETKGNILLIKGKTLVTKGKWWPKGRPWWLKQKLWWPMGEVQQHPIGPENSSIFIFMWYIWIKHCQDLAEIRCK